MNVGQRFQPVSESSVDCRGSGEICRQLRSIVSGVRNRLSRPVTGRMPVLLWLALFCLPMVLVGAENADSTRFEAVHVFVDSGSDELAAYQLIVRATKGDVKIVGIEGGEHEAFKQPPFYDPKAVQKERVILAAFSLKPKGDLPKGKVRVATIHFQVTGDREPKFEAKLQATANHAGKKISPTISIETTK